MTEQNILCQMIQENSQVDSVFLLKQQNKSEREIQGKLINLNKQYILNPSDSLKKDMEKTEMELKKS
jgi:hypothetical protein